MASDALDRPKPAIQSLLVNAHSVPATIGRVRRVPAFRAPMSADDLRQYPIRQSA
jgi:hypothetical protein